MVVGIVEQQERPDPKWDSQDDERAEERDAGEHGSQSSQWERLEERHFRPSDRYENQGYQLNACECRIDRIVEMKIAGRKGNSVRNQDDGNKDRVDRGHDDQSRRRAG